MRMIWTKSVNAVLLLIGLAIGVGLSEVLLRACGYRPWVYARIDANEPTMHEPDATLGWGNKMGSYTVPPYDPSGQPIHVTFLDNGRRRTGMDSSVDTQGEVVLIGDSFTQGWAISDNETYAWKLQERFPFLQVLNYGTGGYGSYQSLLMLERELPRLNRPRFVLYGFLEDHEIRNMAPGWWLGLLASLSRRGQIAVPFATFDTSAGLVRHPPERYLALPFRESSALIAFIEKVYMDFKTSARLAEKRTVTEHLLVEMDRVSAAHHATFIVVLLSATKDREQHYIKYCHENNIATVDCVRDITPEMKVPGEGHPNGKMNTLWAECISAALGTQFEGRRG